jgi:hypothetical protein
MKRIKSDTINEQRYYLLRHKLSGAVLAGTNPSATPKLYKLGNARQVSRTKNAKRAWNAEDGPLEIIPVRLEFGEPVS